MYNKFWLLILLTLSAFLPARADFSVNPAERLWFSQSEVVLNGMRPGEKVLIEATMTDSIGVNWSSRGIFFADIDGKVDVATNASVDGTYTGIDERGLIWSMIPTDLNGLDTCTSIDCLPAGAPSLPFVRPEAAAEVTYRASVHRAPGEVAQVFEARQTIRTQKTGVKVMSVTEDRLRGLFYEPEGNGPFPAVMLVTGSGGGANSYEAALLASHGIAAFAIAHFNYKDRPKSLADIPLEYFLEGIEWLQTKTGAGKIGLSGGSRGGEAALLISSMWPERISAVVAGVPSNVAWGGCCGEDEVNQPTWTYRGKSVPTSQYNFTAGESFESRSDVTDWRPFFLPGMIEQGTGAIAVENIKAPILLISGDADLIWPSSVAAGMIEKRLKNHDYPYPVRWLDYPGAGHWASSVIPVTSGSSVLTHPLTKTSVYMGGLPSHNARAVAHSFNEKVAFFRKHLTAN